MGFHLGPRAFSFSRTRVESPFLSTLSLMQHFTGIMLFLPLGPEWKPLFPLLNLFIVWSLNTMRLTFNTVCDIVPSGLKLLQAKFRVEVAKSLLEEYSPDPTSIPQSLDATWVNARSRVIALGSDSNPQVLIQPSEVVKQYTTNKALRLVVDVAITNLQKPMFLPVTRAVVSRADNEGDGIHVVATILIIAAQILLFSPTSWDKELEYSRDQSAYQHRYPTPPGHGGNCRSVADLFSLEDLHRAIVMVYLAIYRRKDGTIALKAGRQPQPRGKWLGYFDNERQIPDETCGTEGASQLSVVRLMKNSLPATQAPPPVASQTSIMRPSPVTTPSKQRAPSQSPLDAQPSPTPRGVPLHFENRDKWLEVQTLFVECSNARANAHRETFIEDGSDLKDTRPLYKTLDPISMET